MSEFNGYLAELRSHLSDLDPKRAEEIIAEVRTHLEARAERLRGGGMNDDDATAAAAREFGDPQELAARLREANRGRRRVGPVRILLSVLVAIGGLLIAFSVAEVEPIWLRAMDGALASRTPLGPHHFDTIVMVLLIAPAAPLAGLLAGRRCCWLAAWPPLAWGLLLWVMILGDLVLVGSVSQSLLRDEGVFSLILVFFGGPLLAGLGLLGARLGMQRTTAIAVWAIGVTYLVVLGVVALSLQVHDLVGRLAIIGISGLILGLLAAALLWQKGKPWRRAVLAAVGVCLIFAALMIASVNRDPQQQVAIWRRLISGEAVLWTVALTAYLWHRSRTAKISVA